jgi:hypothetical protein
MKRTFPLISILTAAAILLSACGSSASNESAIATSVALTVQAQGAATPTPIPPSATIPPNITVVPTLTPLTTPTTVTTPSANYGNCTVANFVDETIPDGAIFKPGETFWKTWRIQNNSSCTWDSTYKLVFWSGDLLGGAYVYNFPQPAIPGQTVEVTILLTAPSLPGSYKGEWKIQTPDKQAFGVGEYDKPLWADIIVSTDEKQEFGITSVSYGPVIRTPQAGCATNIFYSVTATISVNGPIKLVMQWQNSDGGRDSKVKLEFTAAGTQTLSHEFSLHLGASPGDKWMRLVQLSPLQVDYGRANFSYDCK